IAEALRASFLHIVRNAVGHGIEPAAERRALGKPEEGQVEIRASVRGAQIFIEIADDGRGIDMTLLRECTRKRRLPVPDDDGKLLRSIFLPGVSTSKMITDISGRGVGLDVVKTQVEKLHGSIEVVSLPGEGMTLRLSLPLTLTTVRAVLVRAGDQLWALPSNRIERVLRIAPGDVQVVEGSDVLLLDGRAVPVVPLARILGLDEGRRFEYSERVPVVVIGTGGRSVALTLYELVTEQEILVKGLGRRLRRLPYVSGATQINDAETVLILHVAQVLDRGLELAGHRALKDVFAPPPETRPRLVLAEDSPTTRSLETMMLEGAGYEVRATADGVEAWEALQADGADLLVSDIEMPNMDGFDLVKTVRASKRFADLPVILVTGLVREEHRKQGMDVGANAYIVKNAFDQTNLLETIKVLL
ncbi:MAG: hybrid sensor histidine kinase/response regulator, partial [Gammaproteobacteria bacterium]